MSPARVYRPTITVSVPVETEVDVDVTEEDSACPHNPCKTIPEVLR